MDIFEKLKAACSVEWSLYVDHAFVRQIGDGTLPLTAFQTYLVQDYLFLLQFARANALAVYKSRSLPDLRAGQASLAAILDETDLHIRLCERWGLSRERLEATPEHRATVAYTRFVLDCGFSGDLFDLHVALAPCVVGYGEIAAKIVAQDGFALENHPYRDWIGEYAGVGYQGATQAARDHLSRLAERSLTESRFTDLCRIFAQASLLEADFWQMALDVQK